MTAAIFVDDGGGACCRFKNYGGGQSRCRLDRKKNRRISPRKSACLDIAAASDKMSWPHRPSLILDAEVICLAYGPPVGCATGLRGLN